MDLEWEKNSRIFRFFRRWKTLAMGVYAAPFMCVFTSRKEVMEREKLLLEKASFQTHLYWQVRQSRKGKVEI